jgi:hypothetical protein
LTVAQPASSARAAPAIDQQVVHADVLDPIADAAISPAVYWSRLVENATAVTVTLTREQYRLAMLAIESAHLDQEEGERRLRAQPAPASG